MISIENNQFTEDMAKWQAITTFVNFRAHHPVLFIIILLLIHLMCHVSI